jgi:dolichol-phosphate mannosyltransferase
MQTPDLSIVIPVHNEEQNVHPLVEELRKALSGLDAEFIFVDDGSTDATLEQLREAARHDDRIRFAHFRRNLGQTAAMAAGFRLARGQAVVTLDGDLQNDPADVPGLVALLKDWDVVCGVRVKRRDTWLKRISSRIANGFRNWATGDNIVDTGCTLKAFRRQWLQGLELYQGMHRFLPTLLKMRGARVIQVPVSHRPRRAGKTHYGTWGRMVKGLADVWAVRWMQKNYVDYANVLEIEEQKPEIRSQKSEVRSQ